MAKDKKYFHGFILLIEIWKFHVKNLKSTKQQTEQCLTEKLLREVKFRTPWMIMFSTNILVKDKFKSIDVLQLCESYRSKPILLIFEYILGPFSNLMIMKISFFLDFPSLKLNSVAGYIHFPIAFWQFLILMF